MSSAEPSLADRAADSPWVAAQHQLVAAVADLDAEVGHRQTHLGDEAVALAQPGPVDPFRVARHAAAAGVSRTVRTVVGLPGAVLSGAVVRDPQGWAQRAAVEAFVDQLALGGAASAELARLIEGAGPLYPEVLRTELARRHIEPLPIDPDLVQLVIDRAFSPASPGGGLHVVDEEPITATPVSQLHLGETGEGNRVAVRVRRPFVTRDLDSDSRLAAGAASALGRIAPGVGGMGPLGFVQMTMRQTLEETDLRFEARNLVELGLAIESLGVEGWVVPRPVPGYIGERVLAVEHFDGAVPLARWHGPLPDPAAALAGLAALTLEASLVHGIFWADPAPEHVLVLPDGNLAIAGVGTLGRLSPQLRLAGVTILKSTLAGEPEGQVEAMRIAGAVPEDVDTDALVEELAGAEALNAAAILMGGEAALLEALNTLVGIMLAHGMAPPVEVGLLLRTVFAIGELVKAMDPEGNVGLTAALLPLVPRLPDLLAQAEAAAADAGA